MFIRTSRIAAAIVAASITATLAASPLSKASAAAPAATLRSPVVVTTLDPADDVKILSNAATPVDAVKRSVDIEQVSYLVEKSKKVSTLTVEYTVADVLTGASNPQGFYAVVTAGTKDTWIQSYAKGDVYVLTPNAPKAKKCAGAKLASDAVFNTVTQTIPLSCLNGATGKVAATTVLLSKNLRKTIASDATAYTTEMSLAPTKS